MLELADRAEPQPQLPAISSLIKTTAALAEHLAIICSLRSQQKATFVPSSHEWRGSAPPANFSPDSPESASEDTPTHWGGRGAALCYSRLFQNKRDKAR